MNGRTSTVRFINKHWAHAVIAALCIMGMIMVLYFTRTSPGMSGDSVWYVMGADNLLAGNGYSRTSGGGEIKPIVGFPPFFSITLACLGFLGLNLVDGSRWLNALMFGASAFLVWRLIHQHSGSKWISLAGAVLFLGSSSLIKYHSWVMSEGLYILLTLSVFSLLDAYFRSGKRSVWILAAVLTGAAILTKYIGFSLLFSGALALLLFSGKDRKSRVIESLLYVALASLPVLAWFGRNSSLRGNLTNRAFTFHPFRLDLLSTYQNEIGNWFLFHRLLPWGQRFLVAAAVAIVGPLDFLYKQIGEWRSKPPRRSRKDHALPWMLIFYTLAFLLILVVNSLFLDAATTPSAPERYLAPLYVTSIILILTTTYDMVRHSKIRFVLGVPLALLLVGISLLHPLNSIRLYGANGVDLGYQSLKVENPELVEGLRAISQDRLLCSDNPERTYALTGRTAYFFPVEYSRYTQQANPDYIEQIEQVREVLQGGGRLIIFGDIEEDRERVFDLLDLVVVDSFPGATVYRYREN